MYLSRHQLAHTALGALKPPPIAVKTVSQYIKDFAEGQVPDRVSASHTQGPHVLVFVRACPPKVSDSMMSFTMQINFSRLSLNIQ